MKRSQYTAQLADIMATSSKNKRSFKCKGHFCLVLPSVTTQWAIESLCVLAGCLLLDLILNLECDLAAKNDRRKSNNSKVNSKAIRAIPAAWRKVGSKLNY